MCLSGMLKENIVCVVGWFVQEVGVEAVLLVVSGVVVYLMVHNNGH